jgi:hypothetical protein
MAMTAGELDQFSKLQTETGLTHQALYMEYDRLHRTKARMVQVWCKDTNEVYGDPEPDYGIRWVDGGGASKRELSTPSKRAPKFTEREGWLIVDQLLAARPNRRWALMYTEHK